MIIKNFNEATIMADAVDKLKESHKEIDNKFTVHEFNELLKLYQNVLLRIEYETITAVDHRMSE
ncbi:hypothetical protein [Staphylococcus aureus]|uniref:hypothetical protein n=1 Tax=Staphylococcus aureus TaxID=1280 RepID=UPI000851F4E9|nr:hypothetical protein [Staphylococcus aureus]